MNDTKFETWLGSIVNPDEPFYLIAENDMVLNQLIERTAKIGYEKQIALAFVMDYGNTEMNIFDSDNLKDNEDAFTIVDIRNHSEVKKNKIFANAIHIPLHELRERTNEIPVHKPIVVHCAGGYRSAAGSSIIKSKLNGTSQVFDLSEAVKQFQK
jgi:rhodanese-related sulfurtransferase